MQGQYNITSALFTTRPCLQSMKQNVFLAVFLRRERGNIYSIGGSETV